jgi:hypothetical protein
MNPIAVLLLGLSSVAILAVSRRWALVALLAGTCYVTRAQGIDLGPFSFTVFRILIAVGLFRIAIRGEWLNITVNKLDVLIVLWGIWLLISVAFHRDPSNQVIERMGFVFDAWGSYFLTRCFSRTWEESASICFTLGLVLTPIAFFMLLEKTLAHNYFAFLGGVPEVPHIREGHVRAQGPFSHAILAGTIGAVCLPLIISSWRSHKVGAIVGCVASLVMVIASGSSGPILSAAAAVGALAAWRYRARTRAMRWGAVVAYLCLNFVMKDPAYFVLARIDLTGGSTGWHRARLIQVSIQQISEWWLTGTDYTRHWMASGVSWSPDHTDITNHYLQMGVLGGLPLMAIFIAGVAWAFVVVGRGMREASSEHQFALWALGASLFCHAATCISVSYFDQSVVFFYLTLGLIGSTQVAVAQKLVVAPVEAESPTSPRWPRPTFRPFSVPSTNQAKCSRPPSARRWADDTPVPAPSARRATWRGKSGISR